MSRRSLLLLISVSLVVGCSFLFGADPAAVPENQNGLTSEAAVVFLDSVKHPYVLRRCLVKTLGERGFLVGSPTNAPWLGQRLWIPLSDVTMIHEFESIDALNEGITNLRKSRGEER